MADPEDRYSYNESLDRIYRLLKGETALNEAPETLTPPLHSYNESLSLIAELLAGTLEGTDAVAPIGLAREYGIKYQYEDATAQALVSGTAAIIPFATTGEVSANVAGTSNGLTLNQKGDYMIGMELAFNGSTGTLYNFYLSFAGVYVPSGYSMLNTRETGTAYHVSVVGYTDVSEAEEGGAVRAYVMTPNNVGGHFCVRRGQLHVHKLN